MNEFASPGAVICAGILLVAGACELLWPRRPAGKQAAQRWVGNLALYALSFGFSYLLAPLVAALVSLGGVRLGLLDHIGSTWLHIGIAVLVLDLVDYALHRASHRFHVLWRLHAVHHSDTELDVTTSLRHHPLEAGLSALVIGGGGALLGFSPGEIAAFGMLALGIQIIAHANVAPPAQVAGLLAPLFVTPDFHRLHHSRRTIDADANYGQSFSFWDRLFRTHSARADAEIEFGLDAFRDDKFQRLDRLMLQPLLIRRSTRT